MRFCGKLTGFTLLLALAFCASVNAAPPILLGATGKKLTALSTGSAETTLQLKLVARHGIIDCRRENLTLMLRGIRACADPEATWQIFLELPVVDKPTGPQRVAVGQINFFGAVPGQARNLSFFLAQTLQIDCRDDNKVLNIILQPNHPVATASQPTIERIELWANGAESQ
ncbi:hypothetical protein [Entomohabitans teleogrylli]|uniref:hypothetical protein n=1 Tax=Entomohabitans teleogrylli TaxID=1384589 RepID=UPI00073D2658|nr:hypothetical protein [Entomohabitans teleogrylli]